MQFTYEREDNNSWLTVRLTFTKEVILITQQWTGYYSNYQLDVIEPKELLEILNSQNLLVSNFSGLEDYLKENYPEVLSSKQFIPNYKKLLENLVNLICNDLDSVNNYSNVDLSREEEFQAACLAIDPDWYVGKHLK
jgi:hypothetical protein